MTRKKGIFRRLERCANLREINSFFSRRSKSTFIRSVRNHLNTIFFVLLYLRLRLTHPFNVCRLQRESGTEEREKQHRRLHICWFFFRYSFKAISPFDIKALRSVKRLPKKKKHERKEHKRANERRWPKEFSEIRNRRISLIQSKHFRRLPLDSIRFFLCR